MEAHAVSQARTSASLGEDREGTGIVISDEEKTSYPPAVFDLARDVAGYTGDDAEAAVRALLATRAAARTEKNWELADVVREGLARLGLQVEDTPQGARVVYREQG